MRSVFVADSPAQAHLVAGLLDAAGIKHVVEGEMLFGVRADIGLTPASLPQICVNDEDFERARTVIEKRDPSVAGLPVSAKEPTSRRHRRFQMIVLGAWGLSLVAAA